MFYLKHFVKVDDDQEAWGEMWQVASHSPVEGEKDRKARNMRPRRERYIYLYVCLSHNLAVNKKDKRCNIMFSLLYQEKSSK